MQRARALFDHQGDWLAHTLALGEQSCRGTSLTLSEGASLDRLGTGLLRYQPADDGVALPGLILSAGVHGNETAPIELINELVTELIRETLKPRVPVLLILGNSPAMVAGKRFLEHNLNRLFCGAHADYPDGYEVRRAQQLEAVCHEFASSHPGPLRHYDLHTAIRPSKREKFALYPFVEGRQVPERELKLLGAMGIGTLLLQHQRATTFAGFSSERLGAESFTLELGKVHPFGHNDLGRLERLRSVLTDLMEQRPAAGVTRGAARPQIFQVVHEVLNTGDSFRFHVAEDVANFTEYPPGALIWEDGHRAYRVGSQPEAIVFPNPKVPVGHRVGLMIRKAPD